MLERLTDRNADDTAYVDAHTPDVYVDGRVADGGAGFADRDVFVAHGGNNGSADGNLRSASFADRDGHGGSGDRNGSEAAEPVWSDSLGGPGSGIELRRLQLRQPGSPG